MSKTEYKRMSFAEINRKRKEKDEFMNLTQSDKKWLKDELKHLSYVLDLNKQEFMSLVDILAPEEPVTTDPNYDRETTRTPETKKDV